LTAEQLVLDNLGLAKTVAQRIGRRDDDVEQVAMMGLLKAAKRYDDGRGVSFSTYAWKTIEGEIKRYFRETTWSLHVGRSLQERASEVKVAIAELTAELCRSPLLTEIGDRIGCSVEEVIEVLELQRSGRTTSLHCVDEDDGEHELAIGVEGEFDLVEDRTLLRNAMKCLPKRQQEVLWLRFGEELSQTEIAKRVGVSQMHVSRLLEKSLAALRDNAE